MTPQPVDFVTGSHVLMSVDNSADAARRTATLRVTVPSGHAIGADLLCLGPGTVEVDTKPASSAFTTISCNTDPVQASEGTPIDPELLKSATTYMVTLTASDRSRWSLVMFSVDADGLQAAQP